MELAVKEKKRPTCSKTKCQLHCRRLPNKSPGIGLHQFLGVTLWLYLILDPLLQSFDMTAVIIAMTNDVITDKRERAGAISIQLSFGAFLLCLVLPCSLAPISILVIVAVVAATLKLFFSLLCIPETAPNASADASARFNPLRAWVAAGHLICRSRQSAVVHPILLDSLFGAQDFSMRLPDRIE